jgi:hypothetical protein
MSEEGNVRSSAFRRKFVIQRKWCYKLPPKGRTTNFSLISDDVGMRENLLRTPERQSAEVVSKRLQSLPEFLRCSASLLAKILSIERG